MDMYIYIYIGEFSSFREQKQEVFSFVNRYVRSNYFDLNQVSRLWPPQISPGSLTEAFFVLAS